MKETATRQERTTKISHSNAQNGANGVAIAPPRYGLDVVDKALVNQNEHEIQGEVSANTLLSIPSLISNSEFEVNEPDDSFEREAEAVADAVSHSSAPPPPDASGGKSPITPTIQRKTQSGQSTGHQAQSAPPPVTSNTAQYIRNPGVGSSLSPDMRSRIEPKLGTSLSNVRVHTDARAHQATSQLQARAFTNQNHIFLNRRESTHNVRLMAHESTHVVQQGGTLAFSPYVRRSPSPQIQRLPDFFTDKLADYAGLVPGYDLLTAIVAYDPIRGRSVKRNIQTIVKGLFKFLPVIGPLIYEKLHELGILLPAFRWIESELGRLDLSINRLERIFQAAWDDVKLANGPDYNIAVLIRHFGALINDVILFAQSLVSRVMELIREKAIDLADEVLERNKAWTLLKKILHYDPLREMPVNAAPAEILADFLLLIGKEQELAQMHKRGTLETTAAWLSTQLNTFAGLFGEFKGLFASAWIALQPENLANLTANLQNLGKRAFELLGKVWHFAGSVAAKVLELIKESLLSWLEGTATELPGYKLLTIVIKRDVFTNAPVEQTPVNLIQGFMELIPGGDLQFQQLMETGVIAQVGQRVTGLIENLGISWNFVRSLFLDIWRTFSIEDLLEPVAAFARVLRKFQEPIGRLFTFVTEVIKIVIELILNLMNFPAEIITKIINNAIQAFEDIRQNPIGFLQNLLRALQQGFSNFFANILQHLFAGVTSWLFKQIEKAGITPPAELTLESVLDVVFQILGITTEALWQKLAERIGQDKVDQIRGLIGKLEGAWAFIQDVQNRGPAAIWEYIQSQITNLWDMVLQKAQDWIVFRIMNEAAKKLLSFLDPTGITAVINSFQAIFRAIQSAAEYISDLLRIIDDYVSTIASIAKGDVEPGAVKLEQGLASGLPVAIGFLANQVGLGDISSKLAEIISSLRLSVDKAIDWLINKAMTMWEKLKSFLEIGTKAEDKHPFENDIKRQISQDIAPRLAKPFRTQEESQEFINEVQKRYVSLGLKSLTLEPVDNSGKKFNVIATASPSDDIGDLVVSDNVIDPDEGKIRYAVDGIGRPYKAWGWLSKNKGEREKSAQSRVSKELNKLLKKYGLTPRFDAGHLIAAQYGGRGDERNLVPQEMGSNRSWWKYFEGKVADVVKKSSMGSLVYAEVNVTYPENPFEKIITEEQLTKYSYEEHINFIEHFKWIPESMYFAKLGLRSSNGEESTLPTPSPFDARASLPSLGRSLKGVVGDKVTHGYNGYKQESKDK